MSFLTIREVREVLIQEGLAVRCDGGNEGEGLVGVSNDVCFGFSELWR